MGLSMLCSSRTSENPSVSAERRNVLAQENTVYSSGATPTTVPLYPDDRPIYAVIPGFKGLAPYNPEYSGTNTLVGQQVYLSGVPGLPAGTYTLLPAQYATQPGAFRNLGSYSAGRS